MRERSIPDDGVVHTVVVGLDGSPSSVSALDWSAELVGADGLLHAVHAVPPSLELVVAAVQVDSDGLVADRRRQLEHEWTSHVLARGREVVHHLVEQEPAAALKQVAAEVGAGMIAVGVHAQTAHTPRRIGRTVSDLVDRSDVPLAVIPDGTVGAATGAVVVAVGSGAELRPALRWAVGYAVGHDRSLSLVRAGDSPPMFSMDWMLTRVAKFIDPTVLESWALEDLAELADEVQRSNDAELEISLSTAVHRPGPTLVKAGADAALLVLEARTEPGTPVPSWVQHAIRHAPCPTLLFPAVSGRAPRGNSG
jgi:nucleotide-binding universal stress UspA family protein